MPFQQKNITIAIVSFCCAACLLSSDVQAFSIKIMEKTIRVCVVVLVEVKDEYIGLD
jgi:hypothetical protein